MNVNDGERRFLWKALNVVSASLLAIMLGLTGWTLTQVIALKIEVACVVQSQAHILDRLTSIENRLDTAGKTAEVPNEH